MQFFGLSPADYAAERTCEVWPDNWRAVTVFMALGDGSWNMGPSGPTGLRNECFRELRFSLGIKAAEWHELFADIRVMEQAALDAIHKE